MTDEDATPSIRPAEGVRVIRAGGAVLGESAEALEVSLPGDEKPAIYFPFGDAGEPFLEATDTVFRIPGLGQARQHDIIAKSGPIQAAAWVIETPADGAERLKGRISFDEERVTIERL